LSKPQRNPDTAHHKAKAPIHDPPSTKDTTGGPTSRKAGSAMRMNGECQAAPQHPIHPSFARTTRLWCLRTKDAPQAQAQYIHPHAHPPFHQQKSPDIHGHSLDSAGFPLISVDLSMISDFFTPLTVLPDNLL
jgi:hypothetical protein